MAALPLQNKISQSSSFSPTYRTRRFPSGDGYNLRIQDGLNAKVWKGTIVFEHLSTAEVTSMMNFIDGIGSWGTFDYQPPTSAVSCKFSVDDAGPTLSQQSGGVYSISIPCSQEFDLS